MMHGISSMQSKESIWTALKSPHTSTFIFIKKEMTTSILVVVGEYYVKIEEDLSKGMKSPRVEMAG